MFLLFSVSVLNACPDINFAWYDFFSFHGNEQRLVWTFSWLTLANCLIIYIEICRRRETMMRLIKQWLTWSSKYRACEVINSYLAGFTLVGLRVRLTHKKLIVALRKKFKSVLYGFLWQWIWTSFKRVISIVFQVNFSVFEKAESGL